MSSTLRLCEGLVRESTETRPSDLFSATHAVKPAHLALAGAQVETRGHYPKSRYAEFDLDRCVKEVGELLTFGLAHDAVDQASVVDFLASTRFDQVAKLPELINSLMQSLSERLPNLPFKLTAYQSGYSGTGFGVFLVPDCMVVAVHTESPDPTLDAWWARYVELVSRTLPFNLASDHVQGELSMKLEMLALDWSVLNANLAAFEEAYMSESLEPIKHLTDTTQCYEGDEWFLATIGEIIEIAKDDPAFLKDFGKPASDYSDSWSQLHTDFTALLDQHPRLKQHPELKRFIEKFPAFAASAEAFHALSTESLIESGDAPLSASTIIWSGALDDTSVRWAEETVNHAINCGEEGALRLDLSSASAWSDLEQLCEVTGKFLGLCDDVETW